MSPGQGDIGQDVSAPGGRAVRPSIVTSLIGLVAACIVPALIALAAVIFANYRSHEAAVVGETVMWARTTMLLIERDLEGVESGLRVLATTSELSNGDFSRFHARLVEAQKSQSIRNYVLVDPDGRQRVNTLIPYGSPLPPPSVPSRPIQPVFASGRAVLSGVFVAPLDGRQIVTMAVPIFRGDKVVYALGVAMTPEQILASTGQTLPDGWVAAVIDAEGRIVARTRDAERFVGQPAVSTLLKAMAAAPEGTTQTLTMEGIPSTTSFSRSAKYGWTIAVGAPKAMLVASLYRSIAWLAVGSAAVLVLVLAFAFRVSRVVTQSVTSLIEPALALGSGRPVEPPATPFRETDEVGRAIRKASQMLATAQHHAYHDPLTDLRNRTLFDEMATREIAQAYRNGAQLAILAIDLDGFKAVNDQHGHAAGDAVLKAVASRITGLIRGSDVVSRRGGDEFTVLLVDVDGARTRRIADKLLAALSEPYADVEPSVSASIGVARYPHDATTLKDLLECADEALYAAKNAGKRRVVGDI